MKKDQADEFEQELLQPLAKALRTTLGDAGQVHVNNEPHLMTGNRVEYETWLELVLNDARTEVIFRPPQPRRLLSGLAMGKERPIHLPDSARRRRFRRQRSSVH
jgi:hypothetical protein